MASVKSLFLVAVALSAAVLAVNCSPLMEAVQPDVPALPRTDLVAGERQPGDNLVSNMAISESHSGSSEPMKIYKRISVYPGQVITMMEIVDQSSAGDTDVSITEGGPGHNYVVLQFENPANTIQFAIRIFAK